MARKETPMPVSKEVAANLEVIDAEVSAANTLALAAMEQNERVTALARQLNYQGSTDPAVLENSALDAIRRIGAGIFELGGYLLMLKEACPHGHFMPTLDRLGIGVDAAGRYMAVSRRFANSASTRNLGALGVTKLVELLPLDDEQLDGLTDLGQTGELALDDVARMSVKELRAAVRKERREKERHQSVAQETATELAELKTTFKREKPAEELVRLKTEATRLGSEIEALILGTLRQAVIGIGNLGEERGEHTAFLAGVVGGVQRQLTELRLQFDLPDTSATPAPSDVEAAESAAALRAGMAALRAAKATPANQAA